MTKFCPECGTKQRDDNNHYCSNCGFDFFRLDNDSNLNLADSKKEEDNSSVDVPIAPLEGSEDSKFDTDAKSSVASRDSSASSSSEVSASPSAKSTNSSSAPRSSTKKPSTTAKVSSSSNTRTKNYSSKNDLFSNLTFNKCFLAFAVLLIILVIIGMISDATETEPYSDDGLTSFMYESNNYNLNSFLDDYNSYDDSDYDSDYLSYAAYDVSTILKN